MKKLKSKKNVKVFGLVQSGSNTPLTGITFVALEGGETKVTTLEYAGYALGHLSVKSFYPKSERLRNHIAKLLTDKGNREIVDLMMEETIFGIIRSFPVEERKGFFHECCRIIQAEMLMESYKAKKVSDTRKTKFANLSLGKIPKAKLQGICVD